MNEVLIGYETMSIDEKGRVIIPAKFGPKANEDKLIVLVDEHYIELKEYNMFINELKILNDMILNSTDYNKCRFLETEKDRITSCISGEVTVDKQGRINLSKKIVDKYKFDKEIIIEGIFDGFRIWIPDKFDEYQKENIISRKVK